MEKTNNPAYTIGRMISISVLLIMTTCMSCSKTSENVTDPVVEDPRPPAAPPSGEIENFIITDTLVPFNVIGSTIKWLVIGTNSLTMVTLNGIKVAVNGVLDTGPLKQTTTYTLAVNNGRRASATLKVADSITTLLWNRGKRLKQTRAEVYIVPAGLLYAQWVDTTITPRTADQRILFNYDGTSRLIQVTSSQYPTPNEPGRFVVNVANLSFTWQGKTYIIGDLDNTKLVVTFDEIQPNGAKLHTRNTYLFE
jgi:hypothetical protein